MARSRNRNRLLPDYRRAFRRVLAGLRNSPGSTPSSSNPCHSEFNRAELLVVGYFDFDDRSSRKFISTVTFAETGSL